MIDRILVVGAGQMGGGIAQVAAQAGAQVTLVDVSDEVLERGLATIRKSLDRLHEKGQVEDAEAVARHGSRRPPGSRPAGTPAC